MGNWMPQINPALLQQAIGRVPPVVPPQGLPPAATMPLQQPNVAQQMGPPSPMPQMPPQPGAQAMTQNRVPKVPYAPPTIPPVPSPLAPAPPKPTDDPALTGMQDAMAPTKAAQQALDAEQQKYEGLAGQFQNLKPPSYEDYKPKLWQKILAPFIGAAAGTNAGPAVSSMLYGRYNHAQQDYQNQSGKLREQLEAERGIGIPLVESRARVAQEGFTNRLDLRKQDEVERKDTESENLRGELNDIRSSFNNDRITEEQQNRLAKIAAQSDNLDLKQKALALQGELNSAREEALRAKAGKDSTAGADQNGMTASEQRDFNAQTKRYNGEIESLNRERAQMVGIPGDFATKRTAAIDQRLDELHGKVDDAEKGILGKRKSAQATNATPGKLSSDDARGYLTKAGWDGKTPLTDTIKAKARQLAKTDGKQF